MTSEAATRSVLGIALDQGYDNSKHLLFTVGSHILTSNLFHNGAFTEPQKEAINRLSQRITDTRRQIIVSLKHK